jgi:hypothetical protein
MHSLAYSIEGLDGHDDRGTRMSHSLKGEPNDSAPCPFDFGGRLSKDQQFLCGSAP